MMSYFADLYDLHLEILKTPMEMHDSR